jgi:hypothetical protein
MGWVTSAARRTGTTCRREILVMMLILAAATLARGEVYGHWPLDDGQGSVVRDLGPRMENGTIFGFDTDGLGPGGSVWVDDPERGTVLGLGGNTAWVAAGFLPLMNLQNDFSWAFWARQPPGQESPADDIILGNRWYASGSLTDTVPREFIKFTPNRFEYHMNGGFRNDLPYGDPGYIPSNDRWMHHVVVKEGDRLAYYRNGRLRTTVMILDPMFSADPLPFGMGGQNGAETWQGYLSDVWLFDHALSAGEIAMLVQEPYTLPLVLIAAGVGLSRARRRLTRTNSAKQRQAS